MIFLNPIGCPLKVRNSGYFEKGKNYVIVCNHNSLVDILVTTPFMPNSNKTIAKKNLAVIPVFGWIYSGGSVLVDRNDNQSRRKSYDQMKKVLALGLDMVIYPEGTRNRTDKPLKPFYDGAFKLAIDTGKSIIPAVIFNTKKILPVNKVFFLWPHKLEMHFLPPVDSSNISVKELKEKIFEMMWNYYEANY
jgi:1-acyl-sn-glycerol-3-phosphate acyltransferase